MHGKGPVPQKKLEEILKSVRPVYKWRYPYPRKGPSGEMIYDEVLFTVITPEVYREVQRYVQRVTAEKKMVDVQEVNQIVYSKCVLWPEPKIEEILGYRIGYVPSVVKVIHEKSGFVDVDIMDRVLAPDVTSVMLREPETWSEPTEEEIAQVKASVPPATPLYKVTIGGIWHFILRPMTRADLQVLSTSVDDDRIALCRLVTVWPQTVDWSSLPMGVLDAVGRASNRVSGWDLEGEVEEID